MPHAHLAPEMEFSTVALSQLHLRAGCLPHEQVASWAQAQTPPEERPQQVEGGAMVAILCLLLWRLLLLLLLVEGRLW